MTNREDPVAEIVTIVTGIDGCRMAGVDIERRIRELVAECHANQSAERRRKAIPAKDLKEEAAKLAAAFDTILSKLGPETEPEWAESDVKARLEDELICDLDLSSADLISVYFQRMKPWRDALRRIAGGGNTDEGTALVNRILYLQRGKSRTEKRRPLTIAEETYEADCIALLMEATGVEMRVNVIGGTGRRRNEPVDSPRLRFLQLCMRLVGVDKTPAAYRSEIRRHR